jgi:hypothetical protein
VILDDDNKPRGMPVEPGGDIWLSKAEERLTAEAPRDPADNPFTKKWTEVVDINADGTARETREHEGTLVLSDEPAREILSDRFIPSDAPAAEAEPEPETPAAEAEPEPETPAAAPQEEKTEEITGAPPLPSQPPVEGKPAPEEIVATPEAVAANDEHLANLAEGKKKAEKTEPEAVLV